MLTALWLRDSLDSICNAFLENTTFHYSRSMGCSWCSWLLDFFTEKVETEPVLDNGVHSTASFSLSLVDASIRYYPTFIKSSARVSLRSIVVRTK